MGFEFGSLALHIEVCVAMLGFGDAYFYINLCVVNCERSDVFAAEEYCLGSGFGCIAIAC